MPAFIYPPNFKKVTAANPSARPSADGYLFHSAFGRYGEDYTTQGVHIFKQKEGLVTDVVLPEARPQARGLLDEWPDGLYLIGWTVDGGPATYIKIPGFVPFPPPVAPPDPRLKGFLDGLALVFKSLLGLK